MCAIIFRFRDSGLYYFNSENVKNQLYGTILAEVFLMRCLAVKVYVMS